MQYYQKIVTVYVLLFQVTFSNGSKGHPPSRGSYFCEMTCEERKYSLFLRQFLILSFYRGNNQWREKKPRKKERERRDTFPHKVSQTHSLLYAAYRYVGQFGFSFAISSLRISDSSPRFYSRKRTFWRRDYSHFECLTQNDRFNLDGCSALSCPLNSICTDVIYHCSTAPCPPKLECVPRGMLLGRSRTCWFFQSIRVSPPDVAMESNV